MGNPDGLRIKGQPFANFTIHEGHLIRTIVEVDSKVQFGAAGTLKLDIIGNGPTANSIKTLGLAKLKPTLTFRTDEWRSILPEGKRLGLASESTERV
jgi:hypothetical protein